MTDERAQADIASLEEELRSYREEKEKIRMIIGQIGGAEDRHRERILNIFFIALLLGLVCCDAVGYIFNYHILPFQISIEIGVLLVSLKIIWMIHKQAKVEHFQFWILNSIEFRLNELNKQMREMDKKIQQ